MKKELLIAKLTALQAECKDDFPAVCVVLNAVIGAIYGKQEISLALAAKNWIRAAMRDLAAKNN